MGFTGFAEFRNVAGTNRHKKRALTALSMINKGKIAWKSNLIRLAEDYESISLERSDGRNGRLPTFRQSGCIDH